MSPIRVDPRTLKPGDYITIHNGRLTIKGWVHATWPDAKLVSLEVTRDADGVVDRTKPFVLLDDAVIFTSKPPTEAALP